MSSSPGMGSASTMLERRMRGRSARGSAMIAECPLCAHPQGKLGDLGAARIDVHAVQVVLQDQHGHFAKESLAIWKVEGQGAASGFALRLVWISPGFVVDRQQQVEGVEQEVPGAAGGI
jgi:hypothetical protein